MKFIKEMFKGCAASMAGCGCSVFVFMLCLIVLPAIIESTSSEEVGEADSSKNKDAPSVLVIDLSTPVIEGATNAQDFSQIFSGGIKIGLYDFVKAINRAKSDSQISSILIKGKFEGATLEHIWEFSNALKDFKKEKPVYAYLENPTLAEYCLASCASEIYLNPMSEFEFKGIALGGIYIGNALKKYGIDAQVMKAGKYKSFGEMFTSDKMSPEAKENLTQIADAIWQNILSDISENRKIPVEALKKIANETPLMDAKTAKEKGFFDEVSYKDALILHFCEDKDSYDSQINSFKQVSMYQYASQKKPLQMMNFLRHKNVIAVVYMDGTIMDEGTSSQGISSELYCSLLEDLKRTKEVKGVILRINSGGGSAYASEQIRRSVETLALEKPVFASVGDTAASGAYWIATACHKIFAGKNAITGSIGVFGLNFSAQKLANDFGITFDSVKTEKFADMQSLSHSLSQEEIDILQTSVDRVYDKFLTLVSESRKIDRKELETLAEGKIFTASQAQNVRLIDGIADLDTIVTSLSAEIEKITDKKVVVLEFPTPPTFMELFESMELQETPFAKVANIVFGRKINSPISKFEKAMKTRFENAKKSQIQAEMPIILDSTLN